MLARIYATAFTKAADLDEFIKAREEAKLRDHNKLGREMHLFTTTDVIGQGLPLIFYAERVQELFANFTEILLKTKNKERLFIN